jgi:hypothetical protein
MSGARVPTRYMQWYGAPTSFRSQAQLASINIRWEEEKKEVTVPWDDLTDIQTPTQSTPSAIYISPGSLHGRTKRFVEKKVDLPSDEQALAALRVEVGEEGLRGALKLGAGQRNDAVLMVTDKALRLLEPGPVLTGGRIRLEIAFGTAHGFYGVRLPNHMRQPALAIRRTGKAAGMRVIFRRDDEEWANRLAHQIALEKLPKGPDSPHDHAGTSSHSGLQAHLREQHYAKDVPSETQALKQFHRSEHAA